MRLPSLLGPMPTVRRHGLALAIAMVATTAMLVVACNRAPSTPTLPPVVAVALAGAELGVGAVANPMRARFLYSSERPGGALADPARQPRDLSGRSVKTPRVRAIQTNEPGGSLWLLAHDPWLAYQRGRELFLREFDATSGVFGESGRLDGKPLDDGTTKMMNRDHASSCAMCHNTPWRDGGAGATIVKNSGAGRNTTHVFGGGLLEMIGAETRLRLLELADTNRDGWIGTDEAPATPAVLREGDYTLDFGSFRADPKTHRPALNPVLYVWYVDASGERIAWATSLASPGVAGYDFEVQVFGHGQRDRFSHGGITSTLRAFAANAFDIHSGLTACDPILSEEPRRDGLGRVSACGMQQFSTMTTRDRGQRKDAAGRSLDDPDRDGVIEEITAGDLDLIELFSLNHPRPAERPNPAGRARFEAAGCARCHMPDWTLERAREDPDYTRRRAGDRRFFDLETTRVDGAWRGRVVPVVRGAGVVVRGVYSDLLHHDVGSAFHEMQFDGSMIRRFRTTPLWGVGTTAPYGHDGASLDLDHVIRRHGGEAAPEAAAYAAMTEAERRELLEFLRGLELYTTETLPCDVDGDGAIAPAFVVAGVDTGLERFNPEWLFATPGRIEGWVTNPRGERVHSQALTNVRAAYGCDLPYLRDADGNGWPDVLDARVAPR